MTFSTWLVLLEKRSVDLLVRETFSLMPKEIASGERFVKKLARAASSVVPATQSFSRSMRV